MLQDFDGKCMSSSKRQSARQFVAQLDALHKEGNYEEIREMCESYIKRQVLPKHNIYMNKVSPESFRTYYDALISFALRDSGPNKAHLCTVPRIS